MSRCVSFWHKFEQEGNFCGMDPTEISRVKAYLEFVGKIEKTGIEKDFIFAHFTVGAARPLIATKDDGTRTEALNYVALCLKRKEKITEGDLRQHIKNLLESAGKSCSMNARSEKLEISKIPAQPAPEIAKEPQSENPIQSLGDRVRAAEVREAAANQPAPPAPIAAELKEKYNPAATTAQPPCLAGKTCPKCKTDGIRGRVCDVLGVPINQLPGNRCPFPADKAGAFHPASEIDPATGGRLIKNTPYKVMPVQLSREQAEAAITSVVRGYLTKAQQGIWESIRKSGELGDTDLEIFEGLVDDAGGRLP
jgi:hypothetical protein